MAARRVNVTASSLQQLLREFRACELEASEILLSPFNRNQHLYLLLEGELKVYLGSLDNQPVSTLNPGDCAGEISFIDNDRPSAYVVATQPSLVLRLHRESLVKLFAFLAVGAFVTYGLYDGFGDLFSQAMLAPRLEEYWKETVNWPSMVVQTAVAMMAIIWVRPLS